MKDNIYGLLQTYHLLWTLEILHLIHSNEYSFLITIYSVIKDKLQ